MRGLDGGVEIGVTDDPADVFATMKEELDVPVRVRASGAAGPLIGARTAPETTRIVGALHRAYIPALIEIRAGI